MQKPQTQTTLRLKSTLIVHMFESTARMPATEDQGLNFRSTTVKN